MKLTEIEEKNLAWAEERDSDFDEWQRRSGYHAPSLALFCRKLISENDMLIEEFKELLSTTKSLCKNMGIADIINRNVPEGSVIKRAESIIERVGQKR